ncbi:MAG: hypothetical protein CSB55_05990 [Candidatus Cloacimonadota bacterium]|nr:MAG: hypothetical protein CSB55_05990 [Candidatus Cloacimonadota bacterium]
MNIKFKDVNSGIVEARAVIEIAPGILLNEVTVLRRNNQIQIELPKKSFKGKAGKVHFLDIISFEDENRKTLWLMEIKEAYFEWRKENKKVLVYESDRS